jgi:hypothetical protein
MGLVLLRMASGLQMSLLIEKRKVNAMPIFDVRKRGWDISLTWGKMIVIQES